MSNRVSQIKIKRTRQGSPSPHHISTNRGCWEGKGESFWGHHLGISRSILKRKIQTLGPWFPFGGDDEFFEVVGHLISSHHMLACMEELRISCIGNHPGADTTCGLHQKVWSVPSIRSPVESSTTCTQTLLALSYGVVADENKRMRTDQG